MALDFPSSPSLNDIYQIGNKTWKWNGEAWQLQGEFYNVGSIYDHANGAFDLANGTASIANTDVTNVSVNSGTYGNTTAIPSLTIAANGRITAVTTVSSELVNDTTPQLGGNLDLNGNDITGTGDIDISGDVTLSGNLTVTGETTYANTTTINLGDNIITLNADIPQDSAPSENAGIEIDRGSSDNVSLLWNETDDEWTFTNDGSTYSPIASADRLDSAYTQANASYTHAEAAFSAANTLSLGAITVSSFSTTANGLVDTFDLGFTPQSNDSVWVSVGGVTQVAGDGYFVNTSTDTITFTSTPDNGESIYVVSMFTNAQTYSQFESTAAYAHANGAFDAANTNASSITNTNNRLDNAYFHANSAYNVANTDVTNISISADTYGNSTAIPSVTVEANGRVSAITTTSISIPETYNDANVVSLLSSFGSNTITTTGDISVGNVTTTGTINIASAFEFPVTDGSADQVLVTDGAGTLTWTDQSGGGGANVTVSTFSTTANGSVDSFELGFTPDAVLQVSIDGVTQAVTTNYTISGSTITFTSTPDNGSLIYVNGFEGITPYAPPAVTLSNVSVSGDGITTEFNLGFTPPTGDQYLAVSIDGIVQTPTTHYSVNATAQTITFGEAPANTANIYIASYYTDTDQYITVPTSVDVTSFDTTSNGLVSSFDIGFAPINEKSLIVSLDGVLQQPNSAYTVSGNTITFSETPADTVNVVVTSMYTNVQAISLAPAATQQIEGAFDQANAAFDTANTAQTTADAAFEAANNAGSSLESGGTITGNLVVTGTMNAASYIGDGSALTGIESLPASIYSDGSAIANTIFIDSGSNVGISTSTPSYDLEVNGTFGATTITETSSIRYKENIVPIENGLNTIIELQGVLYNRKDTPDIVEPGLIAEDVYEIIPEIVSKDKDGNIDGIHYSKLTAYLIEAVKSLKAEIDELKRNR